MKTTRNAASTAWPDEFAVYDWHAVGGSRCLLGNRQHLPHFS